MDLSPQAKVILIFYDETAGELERYDSSVQALSQFTTCQITTDPAIFFGNNDVKKQFRRYVSFQALLRQSQRLKSTATPPNKYLVFGQLNAQTRTAIPQHIWRHVQLLTNHIDRIKDFLMKESTPRKSRNCPSEDSLMFYLTKSAQLQLAYQISQLLDCRLPISNICDQMSSSPKFTPQRHVYLVADMQNFSKLYLLTKQLQIRSEISYILLVERGDPQEITRRLQDHYKQQVKVCLGRWKLLNFLSELNKQNGILRNVKIEDISNIINVRGATEDRWLAQHNVDNLDNTMLIKPYNLIFVKQSDALAIYQQLSRMNLASRTLFFTQDMLKQNYISFQSTHDISIIISTDPDLLNKLQYRQYQSKNQKLIVRNMLQNTHLTQQILDKIENTLYFDKELIKVFSSQSFYNEIKKQLPTIQADRIIHYDMKIIKSLNQYVNSKDFLVFENMPQLNNPNGRCIHISQANFNTPIISLRKCDLAYYIKRQKQLEKAYESYSEILEIQSLGVYFIGNYQCLQKRLRQSKVQLKLDVQIEKFQTTLRTIQKTTNDVNVIIGNKIDKIDLDVQNVYVKPWQQCSPSTVQQLFSSQYQLLIILAQCLQQYRLKSSHKPDYINLRIFNFKNAQISQYLQKTLEKKQLFLYKRQEQFNDIFGQLDKNIKEVILMSLEGYTQEMEKKVEELHRNKLITFQIILVTPKAYILKTFKRKGTGYEFLSEKELKGKIDQWRSLREEEERLLQVELLAKMKQEVERREGERREGEMKEIARKEEERREREMERSKVEKVPYQSQVRTQPKSDSKLDSRISHKFHSTTQSQKLLPNHADSLTYSISKNEASHVPINTEQTIAKINKLTVLTQSIEIKPTETAHKIPTITLSKPLKALPLPQQNQPNFPTFISSTPQFLQPVETITKPAEPIPPHPHSANSKQKQAQTRESSFRLMTEEPRTLSPIPIRQQNMNNSTDQIFQDLTGGVSQIQVKKNQRKKSSRPEKAVRTVKLLKNGKPISREKTLSATSSQKNRISKVKQLEMDNSKKIPDHFRPFLENKQVTNEYYVSSNHAEQRIKAEMLLSQSKRSISQSLKRMNSGYAAQKITNYRILKSRDPAKKDCLSTSSRSNQKKHVQTLVQDPFQQFNQCQAKIREMICHENAVVLYIPVAEEQFSRNLKSRLTINSRVVIRPYFNLNDVKEQTNCHTIIVSGDLKNYVEKQNLTWIFVTKNHKKVVNYGSVFHFPSLAYCQQFIVEMFRPKIQHVATLTSSTSIKKQKKRVYVFFRLDSPQLWQQAKKCQTIRDCKTKPYKPGCLGLTLTDVSQSTPVIILTTDAFYDEQAYVVYSLRKNIEIFSCKSSQNNLVKKIQEMLSENVERPIEKVKLKKPNKILKQFKSCTLIRPNF